MGPTIKQIAELANVSRGTVDRVLNGRPGVKPDIRQRVQDIADALDYKPNLLGKALVGLHEALRIGVILTPENNPFIDEVKKGIQRAIGDFGHYGLEVVIRMLPTLDYNAQLVILNEMMHDGIDAVAMIPLDHELIREKINEFSSKNIPVITFNSRIENVNELCFVGQNHVLGGACAGGLMGRLLPDGGEVGVIISSNSLACHQDRLSGFKERIQQRYPNIDIVSILENCDTDDLAFQCALRQLNAYPNLKGIYITGGGVVGLGRALKISQKSGKVKVISHDFIQGTLELLQEGTLDFAIGQNPHMQGYTLIKLFFDYLIKKEPPQSKMLEIPVEIGTEDNIVQISNNLKNTL